MSLPEDVLTMLRAAVELQMADLGWIERSGKSPLCDDGYARIEMTVGDVRRLHAALCMETKSDG